MSDAQLGALIAATLIMLVAVMIFVVIFSRVRVEWQWIVYLLAYLLGLYVTFGIPVDVDVTVSTVAAILVLPITIRSYCRTMRRKAQAASGTA